MTTVLFVHGTGVRSPDFEPSFAQIAHELGSRRSNLQVVPCLWGNELGARLHAQGASIPHYDSARGLDVMGDEVISVEDNERMLWALLYQDPLYELRLLALRASGSPGNIAQTDIVFGRLSPSDELDECVHDFVISSELEAKLDTMGIASVFSQARHALVTSTAYRDALQTVQEALGEYRIAVARSVMALSIALCEQQQQPATRLWDAQLRDEIVLLLSNELGDIAKRIVANPLTHYLRRGRGKLSDAVLPASSGDILLYQARGEPIRQFIRQQIEQAEPPVVLLAHSLGGIACVDLLVQHERMRQLVQLLVTVGSQAPFLYEIGALQSLPPDQKLPADFPSWLNIYDLNDFLRACLKRSACCQSPDHQASHGKVDEGFATLRKRFIILAEPATLGNPSEGPFDHPAPGQDNKAFLVIAAQHWAQTEAAMQDDPFQQATAIGAIDPDEPQLFTGTRHALEQLSGAFRIRKGGSSHNDDQEEAHGIDQDMALATFDMLACIVAAFTRPLRGLDALAVHRSSRGVLMTTSTLAYLSTKRVMHALPRAIIAKLVKVRRDALPAGIVLGQHAPLISCHRQVQERVQNGPHTQRPGASSCFSRWDQIFDTIPLSISQIGWVCLVGFHLPSIPDLTGLIAIFSNRL